VVLGSVIYGEDSRGKRADIALPEIGSLLSITDIQSVRKITVHWHMTGRLWAREFGIEEE
jgi:hypothetical protein